jgi:alkylhydroperoxidase/carboxymuconolactone decarboxylase family protein YurZ
MTDDRRRRLREAFIEARGFWTPLWEGLLELDPDFFEAYLEFSSVPWRNGPLEPKVKELVLLAMDAAATHLFEPGIRQHVRNAIGHGATPEELMEVLELTSTLGIHACNVGVPILVEELESAGQPIVRELDDRRRALKADFEAKRGYWNPFWDDMLSLDPDFLEAYTRFSSIPWTQGVLEPKVKELIYIAYVDAGISGGAAGAEAGTLTIMAGGEPEALDAVRPVLAHFATTVHHMGASGSGHVAKLLNNFLNAISLAATAEVMVAARKAGLDLRQLLEVVNTSSGVNFATLNRFPRIVEGDYLEGGLTSDLMAKDLMLYLELVRELGVTSLNGPPCLAAFHLAAALGYGDQISNRVVDALGDIAGGVRIHDQTREAT